MEYSFGQRIRQLGEERPDAVAVVSEHEHAMNAEDWSALEATADTFLPKEYVRRYWLRVSRTFDPGFRHFVDSRIRLDDQKA